MSIFFSSKQLVNSCVTAYGQDKFGENILLRTTLELNRIGSYALSSNYIR